MSEHVTDRVIAWAAQECEWQQSGERSVGWMLKGWRYALGMQAADIDLEDVLALGALVEPRHNLNGLRKVAVRVGWDVKMAPYEVPIALERLLQMPQSSEVSDAWFREYEEIHPFRDGNGRSGSILWNWMRGILDEPSHPPNLWHDPRRDCRGYPDPIAVDRVAR